MSVSRSNRMPPVGAAMTPFPYFVEESDPMEDVSRLMAEHAIRRVQAEVLRQRFAASGGSDAA